jgi:UDP-glucose 4-epimerase
LEVIEAVKRASGSPLSVRIGQRRHGDAVEVVADARQIRDLLKWAPEFESLDTIVSHAIAWERVISQKNSLEERPGLIRG